MGRAAYEHWLTDEGLAQVVDWCTEGREDKQIAKLIGVHPGTLCEWKNLYPKFAEAFKTGRSRWFQTSLPEVENAAYKLAVGYSYKEVTRERMKDKETGEYVMVVTKEVTKHQPANPVSNMYWLQNRAPEDWKDRRNAQPEGGASGETGVVALAEVKGDA